MTDAFGNELNVGDFIVYGVGQGSWRGGLRFGRVTRTDKTVFTSIEKNEKWNWNSARREYDKYPAEWREEKGRRISSTDQVMRIAEPISAVNDPELQSFIARLMSENPN